MPLWPFMAKVYFFPRQEVFRIQTGYSAYFARLMCGSMEAEESETEE